MPTQSGEQVELSAIIMYYKTLKSRLLILFKPADENLWSQI